MPNVEVRTSKAEAPWGNPQPSLHVPSQRFRFPLPSGRRKRKPTGPWPSPAVARGLARGRSVLAVSHWTRLSSALDPISATYASKSMRPAMERPSFLQWPVAWPVAIRYNTLHCNTIQYNTIPCNTIQPLLVSLFVRTCPVDQRTCLRACSVSFF
jgi:hypothetical protein